MEFLIVFENHIWKCHIHILTAIESRLTQQQISFKKKDSPKRKEKKMTREDYLLKDTS